jgi:hypothetical protein
MRFTRMPAPRKGGQKLISFRIKGRTEFVVVYHDGVDICEREWLNGDQPVSYTPNWRK